MATLQTTQAQSDKDNADLKAKVDALNTQIMTLGKQSADDKIASDKTIADLKEGNQDHGDRDGRYAQRPDQHA